jgi:predicted RNA-binding Zn-ribbon protein involved in translation (DUF1610 family)
MQEGLLTAMNVRTRLSRIVTWISTMILFLVCVVWWMSTQWLIVVSGQSNTVMINCPYVSNFRNYGTGLYFDPVNRAADHDVSLLDRNLFYQFDGFRYTGRIRISTIAIAPAIAALAFSLIARTARLSGSCQSCGYNLTGNVSGQCPECGTEICRPGQPEDHSHGLAR